MHRPDVTLIDLRAIAEASLVSQVEGDGLTALEAELVRVGLAVAVTSLDNDRIDDSIAKALAAGATVDQIQEVISLVSGLGVHSLMATAASLLRQARESGQALADELDDQRQTLWNTHVGDDPYWKTFEREAPGFLRSLLILSPEQFRTFFDYAAVPWRSGAVRARLKELIAMASDATPAHRYLPGFRLHLANALALGAGRKAVRDVLDIAAEAPPHRGTR